ncbi:MAG TPA: DsbE family thiol:disulfide interchange protein [Gammaproteobacteria bacterium]|nr:DsbE family thiol:disulfide interchange protein [Gammaproteobacteria bacterium]
MTESNTNGTIVSDHNAQPTPVKNKHRLANLLPLAIFVVIAIFLGVGLTMDPTLVPSPLINKSVPQFSLPAVKGRTLGLASKNLVGKVSLVNVFASWCTACRAEHPLWMQISREKIVPIHGLNYKDKPDDAANWLDELGDPYTRTGADIDGKVAIDWGVYGVPETFVIDKTGHIVYKRIGAINPEIWSKKLLPMIRKLQQD